MCMWQCTIVVNSCVHQSIALSFDCSVLHPRAQNLVLHVACCCARHIHLLVVSCVVDVTFYRVLYTFGIVCDAEDDNVAKINEQLR